MTLAVSEKDQQKLGIEFIAVWEIKKNHVGWSKVVIYEKEKSDMILLIHEKK